MSKFVDWYNRYYTEICWFTIGWLVMSCLEQVGRENWSLAFIDAGLAYFNYYIWKVRQ
jgi:hypothetical protein